MRLISSGPSTRRNGSVKSSINAKRELVRSALRMHSGNKLRAAQELRISRCYLHRLLNQLNIKEDGNQGAGDEAEPQEDETVGIAPRGGEPLKIRSRIHRVAS